jgi:hypothetical protein
MVSIIIGDVSASMTRHRENFEVDAELSEFDVVAVLQRLRQVFYRFHCRAEDRNRESFQEIGIHIGSPW